jgi:hypothetical protein
MSVIEKEKGMRSPMIETAYFIPADEKPLYTDMQVLQSGGGWYVGTYFNNPDGFIEPGSRDSDYFPDKATAEAFFEQLKAMEPKERHKYVRLNP